MLLLGTVRMKPYAFEIDLNLSDRIILQNFVLVLATDNIIAVTNCLLCPDYVHACSSF